jgi:hypothetical protein
LALVVDVLSFWMNLYFDCLDQSWLCCWVRHGLEFGFCMVDASILVDYFLWVVYSGLISIPTHSHDCDYLGG